MAYFDPKDTTIVAESPEGSRIFDELAGSTTFAPGTTQESIIGLLINQMNRRGFSEEPKAHEQMDAIIGQNEMQMLLKQAYNSSKMGMLREFAGAMNPSDSLSTGSSYETDPEILGQHKSLLHYLSKQTPSLEERRANIERFPSFESRGETRYTAPITQDDRSVREESRSMEHWLQDYDYLYNRTALSKP